MVSWVKCCARSHSTGVNKCCDNCDCDERREALRIRQRNYRAKVKAKKAGLGKLSAVPDIPASRPAPPPTTVETDQPLGRIGRNALTEIAKIPGATERNPLIVAMILRLATEIDRNECAQLASAANTIQRMMNELRSQAQPAPSSSPAGVPDSPQARFWADWQQAGS